VGAGSLWATLGNCPAGSVPWWVVLFSFFKNELEWFQFQFSKINVRMILVLGLAL
jgi:hypothetical protein